MNFIERAKIALNLTGKAGMFAISGQWEGSERNRLRDRPTPRRVSQDADLNIGVREDLMAEARALCQTVGIGDRILRQFANYTVGECRVKFATADPEWNKLANESTKAWADSCDVRRVHSLRDMAKLCVMSEKRDGDIFINEVTDDGRYELEMIEADRVTNARGSINIDEERIVGGVLIDRRGRPYAYRVQDRMRKGGFEFSIYVNPRDIEVGRIFHYFDPMRADAYRGVTAFKTALNHLRDIKETIAAEKTAQKAASKLALIVKNAMGGVTPGINPFAQTVNVDRNKAGNDVSTKEIEDGVIQYLVNGDSIEAFMSARPGQGWFDLVLFIIRDIAIGLDLPFEFVWSLAGMNGTATRLMSAQAERTFVNCQENLERRFLDPVIIRRTMFEMENGRLPFNSEFYKFKVQRPAHPTVDVGRESSANLAELNAGVITEDDIAQEAGRDGSEIRLQRGRETRERLKIAQEIAVEFGIELELALALTGRSNPNIMPVQEPQGQSEDAQDEPSNPQFQKTSK